MKKFISLLAVIALFSAGLPAQAGTSCCEVTAIHAKDGTAMARINANGKTFMFKVSDPKMLQAVKVGDAVQANFKTGRVTVKPKGTIPPIAGVILLRTGFAHWMPHY